MNRQGLWSRLKEWNRRQEENSPVNRDRRGRASQQSLWDRFREFNRGRSQIAGVGLLVIIVISIGLAVSAISSSASSSDTAFSDESEEALPELSTEEEAYLDERISINDEAIFLANEQLDLAGQCPEYCISEKVENWNTMYSLNDEAQDLIPPGDYVDSHGAFLAMMGYLASQSETIATMPVDSATADSLDYLTEQSNEFGEESVKFLPPNAQEYYNSAPSL